MEERWTLSVSAVPSTVEGWWSLKAHGHHLAYDNKGRSTVVAIVELAAVYTQVPVDQLVATLLRGLAGSL